MEQENEEVDNDEMDLVSDDSEEDEYEYVPNPQGEEEGQALIEHQENNNEGFIQFFEAVPRLIRNRLRRRAEDGDQNEESENDNNDEEESESEEDENAEGGEKFDPNLPTQHSYLGQGQEITGRTILDEDLVQEIAIISRPGIILMPGQTLPMNFFHPTIISVMKTLIEGSKTFGVVHQRYRSSAPGLTEESNIGTTAEIYEFREPSPESLEVGLKIKCKGRQRFRILSMRRQIDGTKIATVEFLKEIKLTDPFRDVRLLSRDRLKPFPLDEVCESQQMSETESPTSASVDSPSQKRRKSKLANFISRLRPHHHQEKKDAERANKPEYLPPTYAYKLTKFNHYRTSVGNIPLTPFPKWVYEQYDANCLVEKAHQLLGRFRLFSQTHVAVPREPIELSYWLASNLPLDDKHKLKILGFNCAIRRLRYQISIMEQCPVLSCRNCGELIARQDDIFSMSSEGPQGAYVNPGGYVHETLTLYKTKNLFLVGESSTQYSWFPGYAWTICQCKCCDSHMGWKFTATKENMVPKKFWGISRRSIRPELMSDDQTEEEEEIQLVY